MRVCLIFIFFLGATFAPSVTCKSHGKQHGIKKTSDSPEAKDAITVDVSRPQVFPTLVTFKADRHEQEDEEGSSGNNANAKKGDEEVKENEEKTQAVLLSEEELTDLLKKEVEEDEEAEENGEHDNDEAPAIAESEITLENKKKPDDSSEAEEKITYEVGNRADTEEEVEEAEEKAEKPQSKLNEQDGLARLVEETESSTESEFPADFDYAADSGISLPIQVESEEVNPSTKSIASPLKKDLQDTKKEELDEKESLMQDMQSLEAVDRKDVADENKHSSTKPREKPLDKKDLGGNMDHQGLKSDTGLRSGSLRSEQKEKKGKSDTGVVTNTRNTRKQKKHKRARKHSPQRNETHPAQDEDQRDHQESEGSRTENVVHKAKRKRTGKWGPLVGVNPVQIRASVDLYPRSRSSLSGDIQLSATPADPCESFRCKRGKTCKLQADGKPGCVCQEPLECPPSMNEFEHVCGTDNKTYDSSCKLFATKCKLEGTKKGNKLHLDYAGPCKLIPQCAKNESVQFPSRMRDWSKNVLSQLYEHDSISPGFLTPKQRFRVKKIFENERRLHAGNHSVELLASDFEKNYNMYIYPVHWQFAQSDQHPSDRISSHSESAPLRVPLVPMEHCTSRFFQECDADKDKQVTSKEWTSCFGLKDEDMDVNSLF